MPPKIKKETIKKNLISRGLSSEQADATSDSLLKIYGDKFEKQNPLLAILDIFSSGAQAGVGLYQEQQRRKSGFLPRNRWEVMKGAIQDSATWSQVTGNAWTGLGLDIILDPANILAFGVGKQGAKLIVKGLGDVPEIASVVRKARAVGEATSDIADSIEPVRKIRVALGRAFKPGFMLARTGVGRKILEARARFLQNLNEANYFAGVGIRDEIEKLVPNIKRREELLDIIESRPVTVSKNKLKKLKVPAGSPRLNQQMIDALEAEQVIWRKRLRALSPKERKAYDVAVRHLDNLEVQKVKAGLLSTEQAAGLIIKMHGLSYVPHHMASRESFLSYARAMERNLKLISKNKAGLRAMKSDLRDIRRWIARAENMPESLNTPVRERLRRQALESTLAPRKIAEKAKTIKERGWDMIELDIARVLQVESVKVARMVARQNYLVDIVKYVDNMGLAFTEKEFLENPDFVYNALKHQFGERSANKLWRDGMRRVEKFPVKGLQGQVVPRAFAEEIERVARAYSNTSKIRNGYSAWLGLTRFWKAWTLAPIPTYHSRNVISNIWNSILGGMSVPSVIEHNKIALPLRLQWGKGVFTGNAIFKHPKYGNISSKRLNLQAVREGILNTGHIAGEITGGMMDHGRVFGGVMRQLDPKRSIVIKKGFQLGTYLEDSNKLAMFMWRLSKGDTFEQAGKAVRKYLFDYKHGLTEFEERWFRDGIIPFYAWTRFNLPLQLERLAATPYKFTFVSKGKRSMEDMWGGPDPDDVVIADWIKESTNVRFRWNKETNTYDYFMLDSYWPAADIARFLGRERTRNIVGMVNPFAKLPFELVANYNLFQGGRKIKEFAGQRKKLLGIPLEPRAEHLMRTVRVFNEIDRIVSYTAGAKGEDFFDNMFFRALGRTFIGRTYPVDYNAQRRWWESNMRRDIIKLKGMLKSAERKGDVRNARALTEAIERYEKLLEEHAVPTKTPKIKKENFKTKANRKLKKNLGK